MKTIKTMKNKSIEELFGELKTYKPNIFEKMWYWFRRTFNSATPIIGIDWWQWLYQRKRYGFDDRVTWDLYIDTARWILPRLKRFKKVTILYPCDLTFKQWQNRLDKMIFAFEYISKDDIEDDIKIHKKNHKKAQEGLDLFAKHFKSLWW